MRMGAHTRHRTLHARGGLASRLGAGFVDTHRDALKGEDAPLRAARGLHGSHVTRGRHVHLFARGGKERRLGKAQRHTA